MAVGIRKVQQKELSKSAIVLPTFQEETNVLADLDFMLDSEMNLDKIDQHQNVRHNPKDYRHCFKAILQSFSASGSFVTSFAN